MRNLNSNEMKQLEFKKVGGWGGKKRGAGKPNRLGQVSHGKRAAVDFKKPLHITIKRQRGVRRFRNPVSLNLFKEAVARAQRFGLYIVHYSLQTDHIHLIAEAKNNSCLSNGMKSFAGRLGRLRKGGLFCGRFHLHVLKTP